MALAIRGKGRRAMRAARDTRVGALRRFARRIRQTANRRATSPKNTRRVSQRDSDVKAPCSRFAAKGAPKSSTKSLKPIAGSRVRLSLEVLTQCRYSGAPF